MYELNLYTITALGGLNTAPKTLYASTQNLKTAIREKIIKYLTS